MSAAQPTSATYAVCYLDILGYGELVERAVGEPELINKIEELFKVPLEKIKGAKEHETNDEYGKAFRMASQSINARMVSDSILMTMRIDDLPQLPGAPSDVESKLACLEQFLFAASYFCHFIPAKLGYFLRGAITVGQYYESQFDGDLFIFSQALVDVVKMGKVGPPRVVIGDSVFDFFHEVFSTDSSGGYAFQDTEGKWCLDVYNALLPDKPQTRLILSDLTEAMRLQIASHAADSKIMDKYRWLVRYHNERMIHRFKMPEMRVPEWDVLVRFRG